MTTRDENTKSSCCAPRTQRTDAPTEALASTRTGGGCCDGECDCEPGDCPPDCACC